MLVKTLGPSIGKRLQLCQLDDNDYDDPSCCECREGCNYSQPCSPRDVMHILAFY